MDGWIISQKILKSHLRQFNGRCMFAEFGKSCGKAERSFKGFGIQASSPQSDFDGIAVGQIYRKVSASVGVLDGFLDPAGFSVIMLFSGTSPIVDLVSGPTREDLQFVFEFLENIQKLCDAAVLLFSEISSINVMMEAARACIVG